METLKNHQNKVDEGGWKSTWSSNQCTGPCHRASLKPKDGVG